MNDLHKNQLAILNILEDNMDFPLTIREIQVKLNLSSPSVVMHHLQKLEEKGYLKRNYSNPRNYQIFRNPEKSIVYLNHYGNAQCGINGSILDGNPIDKIPIASKLLKFSSDEGFIVSAKGDSMQPQISENDLVIAKKSDYAENGEIIVCVLNENVLIKKYYKQNNTITLISINSQNHPPIVVEDFFKIEGIVKNIIKFQ